MDFSSSRVSLSSRFGYHALLMPEGAGGYKWGDDEYFSRSGGPFVPEYFETEVRRHKTVAVKPRPTLRVPTTEARTPSECSSYRPSWHDAAQQPRQQPVPGALQRLGNVTPSAGSWGWCLPPQPRRQGGALSSK